MSSRSSHALGKIASQLMSVFDPDDLDEAKRVLIECLNAERQVRSGRGPDGRITYDIIPDYPIRLAASVKIIEWTVGKPISRSINTEIPSPGDSNAMESTGNDLLALLLAAPDAAADIVAKLQQAAQKRAAAEPIDVSATVEKRDFGGGPDAQSAGSQR